MITVALPSGMKGTVRGLKVKEFALFGDRRAMRTGEAIDKILSACWVETLEPGPYENFSWSKALIGDSSVATIAVRRATHGDTMDFDVACPSGECRKIAWRVDLKDLAIKEYPRDAVEKFKAGVPFEATFGGKKVTFSLTTVDGARRAVKLIRDQSDVGRMAAGIAQRLLSVDGVDGLSAIQAWIDDLPLGEIPKLLEVLQNHDGGVDTTIAVECQECGARPEVELPLDIQRFWLARKR